MIKAFFDFLGFTARQVSRAARSIVLPLRRKATPYRFENVEDLPDDLKPLKLYLAGDPKNPWAAAMLCPCRCGARIELNLLQAAKPCWRAEAHRDGTASLWPSVWRQKGCRSHFFLRQGQIEWC